MRLKSSIFVSALMRLENANGAFSTVLNKGAEDAGAIFIVHLYPNGKADFYGPAPQTIMQSDGGSERWFEVLAEGISQQDIDFKIQSQMKFDSDCWVIEIEKATPLGSIQIMSAP